MTLDSPQMFGVALMALWGTAGAVALGRSMAKSPAMKEWLAEIRKMNLAAKGVIVAGLVCAVAIGSTKPGGTNDPPRMLRSPPATVVVEPSFAPVEIRTNNVTLRAESASAVEVGDWRRHGSSSGGFWLEFDEPFFRVGTNPVSRAYVAASGTISFGSIRRPPVGAPLPDGTGLPALAPLLAPLGMVPEANWTNAGAASRFWYPVPMRQIEIVERKGIGHPDSVADGVAETVSEALCAMYKKEVGHVLHHNTDQTEVVAGISAPKFGGGKIIKPVYILMDGRATTYIEKGKEKISLPVEPTALEGVRRYLKAEKAGTLDNLKVPQSFINIWEPEMKKPGVQSESISY